MSYSSFVIQLQSKVNHISLSKTIEASHVRENKLFKREKDMDTYKFLFWPKNS